MEVLIFLVTAVTARRRYSVLKKWSVYEMQCLPTNHQSLLWPKPLGRLHPCCSEMAPPKVCGRCSSHSLSMSDSAPGYFVKIWGKAWISWDLVSYLGWHFILDVGIESKRFIICKNSHCVGTPWSHFAFGITLHIIRIFLLMFFVKAVCVYTKILIRDTGRDLSL